MKKKGSGCPGLKVTVVNQTCHYIKAVISIDFFFTLFYEYLKILRGGGNINNP